MTSKRKRRVSDLLTFGGSILILVTQSFGRERVPNWVTIPVLILVVTSSAIRLMAREED